MLTEWGFAGVGGRLTLRSIRRLCPLVPTFRPQPASRRFGDNQDSQGRQVVAKPRKVENGFGSLFEVDYLVRTLGRIAHDPQVALTELVANAWDAGASLVDLTIPTVRDTLLVVQDDGHGMTASEFKSRWMTLGYDRLSHQGKNVQFPFERVEWRRRAYGRNGVGRHGMLCFADSLRNTSCA